MTRLLLGEDKQSRTLEQLALKLCEEAGEVAREVKLARKADASFTTIENRNELIAELGDVLSAVAKLAEAVGLDLVVVESKALEKRGLLDWPQRPDIGDDPR